MSWHVRYQATRPSWAALVSPNGSMEFATISNLHLVYGFIGRLWVSQQIGRTVLVAWQALVGPGRHWPGVGVTAGGLIRGRTGRCIEHL